MTRMMEFIVNMLAALLCVAFGTLLMSLTSFLLLKKYSGKFVKAVVENPEVMEAIKRIRGTAGSKDPQQDSRSTTGESTFEGAKASKQRKGGDSVAEKELTLKEVSKKLEDLRGKVDEFVNGQPYTALGIAFAVGVTIGALIGWSRRK